MKHYLTFHRMCCIVIIFLLIPTLSFSQLFYLSTNNNVNCRGVEMNKTHCPPITEEIVRDAACIVVCQDEVITFNLNEVNGTVAILSTIWQTPNGNVVKSYDRYASISWSQIGVDYLNITVYLANGKEINYSTCIEVIAKPTAEFIVLKNNPKEPNCVLSPIFFENQSFCEDGKNITHYLWDFGDGNFSSEENPMHEYANHGTYKVTLQVTNECNCSDYYTYTIEIAGIEFDIIECPEVICEGETERYDYPNIHCQTHWEVESGKIIDIGGKGEYVVVKWDDVLDPQGELNYGTLTYIPECAECGGTTLKIPIITRNSKMWGDSILCINYQYQFNVAQWANTNYNWTIVPLEKQTNYSINNYDQKNESFITFEDHGKYQIVCDYFHEMRGCVGRAVLNVIVSDSAYLDFIHGSERICVDQSVEVELIEKSGYSSTSNVNWEIYQNSKLIYSMKGNSRFNFQFDKEGDYLIVANSEEICNIVSQRINVVNVNTQNMPDIIGATKICFNQPYEYELDPNTTILNGLTPFWSVENGVIEGSAVQEKVIVQFQENTTNNQYSVSYRLVMNEAPYCYSGLNNLVVTPKTIDNVYLRDIHKNNFNYCENDSCEIQAFNVPADAEDIAWSIYPLNCGNVVEGQNSRKAKIYWNANLPDSANLIVSIKLCGKYDTIIQPIYFNTAPIVEWSNVISVICANESFTLGLNISNIINYPITIDWHYGNNVVTTSYNQGTNFTSPLLKFTNNTSDELVESAYAVVSSGNNCGNITSESILITVNPAPVISISPYSDFEFCNAQDIDGELSATFQQDLVVTSIEWYRTDGTLVGTSNNLILTPTLGFGSYYAISTSQYGCISYSEIINITQKECIPQPDCPEIEPLVQNINYHDCNQFTIYEPIIPLTIIFSEWKYDNDLIDLVSNNNGSITLEAKYPGKYSVKYYFMTEDSCEYEVVFSNILIPFKPDLKYSYTCNGTDYNLIIDNNSVYSVTQGISCEILVDNVIKGNNSQVQAPVSSGNHTISIRMWATIDGIYYECRKDVFINLPEIIGGEFILLPSICPDFSIDLKIKGAIEDINRFYYQWYIEEYINNSWQPFSQTNVSSPRINTGKPGLFRVRGDIRDNYCSISLPDQTFEFYPNKVQGIVTSSGKVCEGNAGKIEFIPNNPTDIQSIQWMKENVEIKNANQYIYNPTVTGSYWPKLTTTDGCEDRSVSPVNYIIQRAPIAVVTGDSYICEDPDEVNISASFNPTLGTSVQYRWLLNGKVIVNWTNGTDRSKLNIKRSISGSSIFIFEIIDINTKCSKQYSHRVEYQPNKSTLSLSYAIKNTNPYEVIIVANASNKGSYSWSNGDVGDHIYVTHGGAYELTFYEEGSPCPITEEILIPNNPEVYLWSIPKFCINWCEKYPYIIYGPSNNVIFDYYEWRENQNPQLRMWNSPVLPYTIYPQRGINYSLYLEMYDNIGGKIPAESNDFYFKLKKCQDCDLIIKYQYEHFYQDMDINPIYPYWVGLVDLNIVNLYPFNINISIKSPKGDGFYTISNYTLVPGMNQFKTFFIPNNNYYKSTIMEISGMLDEEKQCVYQYEIDFGEFIEFYNSPKVINESTDNDVSLEPKLLVVPSIVQESTEVGFELNNSQNVNNSEILIYNLQGISMWRYSVYDISGWVHLNTSDWLSGYYIVVLKQNNKIVKQSYFIKK